MRKKSVRFREREVMLHIMEIRKNPASVANMDEERIGVRFGSGPFLVTFPDRDYKASLFDAILILKS